MTDPHLVYVDALYLTENDLLPRCIILDLQCVDKPMYYASVQSKLLVPQASIGA